MYDNRVNPNVLKLWLWMIMMCQYRFISCNKCTTVVGDVDDGESYTCMGVWVVCEILIPSLQFCCKPKTYPNKVFVKKTTGKKGRKRGMEGVRGGGRTERGKNKREMHFFLTESLFYFILFFYFLLLFTYSCMPFLPIPPPHPS